MTLKGRRAFITGSFQGIGLGIATELAKEALRKAGTKLPVQTKIIARQ